MGFYFFDKTLDSTIMHKSNECIPKKLGSFLSAKAEEDKTCIYSFEVEEQGEDLGKNIQFFFNINVFQSIKRILM